MNRFLRFFLFSIVFLSFTSLTKAQDFRVKKANQYFYKTYYSKAIPLYEEVISKYQTPEILLNLADSYYFTFEVKKAARYYKIFAARYPEKFDKQHQFQFIQTLKALGNYQEAEKISLDFSYKTEEEQQKYRQRLQYLENVKAIGNRFKIKNLPLNTENSEFGGTILNDQFVFASAEKKQGLFDKVFYWNNSPYLNLYKIPEAELNTASEAKLFSENLTTRFHESNAVFSADGNTVYFTRNNYLNGKKKRDSTKVTQLQIYKAELKNGKWQNVTSLPINSDHYSTEHPALSPDGKTLYFASNKPGGFGSFDLYKVNTNDFKNPENLGPKINTKHKEQFPFIDEEGNLYFASDGHPGFGFLDIFIAKAEENSFSKPDNIGLPTNSGYDDFAFFKNLKNASGYFSSNRPGGKGSDDIYQFQETLPLLIEDCYQFITGTVYDKTTGELLANSTVKLIQNSIIKDSIITGEKANFNFKVNCNNSYVLIGSKKNYQNDTIQLKTSSIRKKEQKADLRLLSEAEKIRIKEENLARKQRELEAQKEAEKIAEQKRIEAEKAAKKERITKIVVEEEAIIKDEKKDRFLIKTEPIYFDYDLWYIRKESRVVLDKVIALLKKYPTMKLEIGTHTDIRGNNKYNMNLSQKRSNSVMEYFNEKGININRITAKGYGETQPIIYCETEDSCTEEQHEINRRCEFVILSFE
ncbi:OmpA family protein [Mesonia maritima]|uniref:Outer membrane protein OmpA-like peptidoglycan-associated protein n=1 Tax=Mesonia maritima TaxID=1793873 RepID=A0ABU1K6Z6_9FLAO|nr:OmpA family protein [Mesonia maritima]MDR6301387.1 outer membrane protein OmpA-like peptidoglycan-associated protein [Mesonia maritima]